MDTAYVADAQDLHLPPSEDIRTTILSSLPPGFDFKFDAVFSNAALHWCKRSPRGVVESASRALKKGGRFVVEMGGFTNVVGQFFFLIIAPVLHVINYYVRCKNGQL